MLELLILGLAGLCFGAGMSAHRHGAPRRMTALWYSLSGAGLLLAALTFQGNG
jgi:hypothetical protein